MPHIIEEIEGLKEQSEILKNKSKTPEQNHKECRDYYREKNTFKNSRQSLLNDSGRRVKPSMRD